MAIPLTQGLYALVDGEDYNRLNQWKWYANKIGNTYYAMRSQWLKTKKYYLFILMHQQIVGGKKEKEIDHINHNGLDNRRFNLRFCSHTQNLQNSISKKGTSKYKGVSWHTKRKHWVARICINGKHIYLGSSKGEERAAALYDQAAQKHFGEFAYLNFRKT